jgi:hypothetical protein
MLQRHVVDCGHHSTKKLTVGKRCCPTISHGQEAQHMLTTHATYLNQLGKLNELHAWQMLTITAVASQSASIRITY